MNFKNWHYRALKSPYPELLPDVFCLMVGTFHLMLVLLYIQIVLIFLQL